MTINENEMNLLIDVPKNKDGVYKNTKSSRKSFPSNHSSNIWALSIVLSYMYREQKKYFIILAVLISVSRVYIGVHYPLDIIIGCGIGLIVGFMLIKCAQKLIR